MISEKDKSIVFLTNLLPPYRLPVFRLLSEHFREFKILLSVEKEENRAWVLRDTELAIEVQQTISLKGRNKHPSGFKEDGEIHLPVDTLRRLYKIRPDVIISAEMGLRTLFSVVYKIINPKVRLICYADLSIYSEKGRGIVRLYFRKFILKFVNAVIVNGEAGKRYIRERLKYKGKIYIAPYPSDEVFLREFKEKDNVFRDLNNVLHLRLLYVGQLIPRKGLMEFIEGLSTAIKNNNLNIKLVLVGEGALTESIRSTNIDGLNIKCVGNIDYDNIHKYYNKSDIFVLPTLADTWALVVNESMACGVPVLGSIYSQAVEEMVQHGVNGWIYDPMVQGDLCSVIDQLVKRDIENLNTISCNAFNCAQKYSAEHAALAMIEAING